MQPVTLLIPTKLPTLLKDKEYLQRITATLLLLKALVPAGRFQIKDKKQLSEKCGFKTHKTLTNHLAALHREKLITYQYHEEHKTQYVVLSSWDYIKKHFEYERNNFTKYTIEFYSAHRVMAILVSMSIQQEKKHHQNCYKANLNGNPELKDALQTVLGEFSREALHQYQLKCYTEGIQKGMPDEYYYAVYMLLHATKRPKCADTEDNQTQQAKRFYIKADCNISVGHLSHTRKYKNRNGMCYWKKVLQQYGLVICTRREYKIANRLRTTTEERTTGIGNTFYDHTERCIKLRLTDEWQFINPEIAFSAQAPESPQNPQKSV